jgi:hypothetical protein
MGARTSFPNLTRMEHGVGPKKHTLTQNFQLRPFVILITLYVDCGSTKTRTGFKDGFRLLKSGEIWVTGVRFSKFQS